ncbi:MAG: TolC family protein [Desulfuromonadaceae bacterium]
MNEAIVMAVSRNIDLKIEALNSRMALVDAIKSRGIYDPLLNVTGSGGVSPITGEEYYSTRNFVSSVGITQAIPTGGSITASTQTGYFSMDSGMPATKEWQATVGINITQPLLKNSGKETFELNISLAATTHQDSLERFRSAVSETVATVIATYNRLYVLRQVLKTREAALDTAQKLLEVIGKNEQRAPHGIGFADAEFAIDQRRKDLVETYRGVTEQEIYLRYLIGLETPDKIIPTDAPFKHEPLETYEQAVEMALELRPEIRQLKSGLQSARLLERVARHQSLPELSVTAGTGVTGTGSTPADGFRQIGRDAALNWTVGMLFNLPLGNTASRNEYIRSRIRTEQAQDQVKAASWKMRNEIQNDMRTLISARLQMQLADKSSQSAKLRFEQYQKNSLLKMTAIQDLLNAENDLNIARNAQMEAGESFSNAVTKLWKDMGILLERYSIRIDVSKPAGISDWQEMASLHEQSPGVEKMQGQGSDVHISKTPAAGKEESSGSLPTRSLIPMKNPAEIDRSYTLILGDYSSKQRVSDIVKKREQTGLVVQVKEIPSKNARMTRLLYDEFPRRNLAEKALKKLGAFTTDGFILSKNSKHHFVYAGSYLDEKTALEEAMDLAGIGINVRLETTFAQVPTFLISAGNFLSQDVAWKYAQQLELLGLRPSVSEKK